MGQSLPLEPTFTRLMGRTATGRATVAALRLNDRVLVAARRPGALAGDLRRAGSSVIRYAQLNDAVAATRAELEGKVAERTHQLSEATAALAQKAEQLQRPLTAAFVAATGWRLRRVR